MANVLSFRDLQLIRKESPVYLETKQTLRPAIYMGIEERPVPCRMKDGSDRFTIHLITPAKFAKNWEWRLYNKTWRLWNGKPERYEQRVVRWDG